MWRNDPIINNMLKKSLKFRCKRLCDSSIWLLKTETNAGQLFDVITYVDQLHVVLSCEGDGRDLQRLNDTLTVFVLTECHVAKVTLSRCRCDRANFRRHTIAGQALHLILRQSLRASVVIISKWMIFVTLYVQSRLVVGTRYEAKIIVIVIYLFIYLFAKQKMFNMIMISMTVDHFKTH